MFMVMEVQIIPSNYQVIFTILFVILMVMIKTLKRLKSKNNSTIKKTIPGPRKLPLIGNLHQVASSKLHRTLRDLASKHGPLMHLQLGEIPTIIVSSSEMAEEVMKTHDISFAYRPAFALPKITSYNFKGIAFTPYGSYWRQIRKICTTELLSATRVQSFRSLREEEVLNLIKTICESDGKPVNISEMVYPLTYGITARSIFGKKCKDEAAFIAMIKTLAKLLAGFTVADFYPSFKVLHFLSDSTKKVEKIRGENDRIFGNIINEHKERRARSKGGSSTDEEETEEDLVDVLLRLQEENEFPLSDENIKSSLLDIFSAGSDTSATTIEWAMSYMLKNPRVMKKAQAEVRQVYEGKGNVDETNLNELNYLKSVIKETLRLSPSVPFLLPRECNQSCEINGYEIFPKTRVLINAWAIGRDPKHWPEAERFYPERFLDSSIDYMGTNFDFIPFGAGRRICPGILFAMPNVQLILAQLLFHFDWKLPNATKPENLDMSEVFGLSLRRKNDLIIVPSPYHGSTIV